MSRPRRARSVTQTTSSNAALCHSKFKSGENHGVVLAFRDMEKGKLWTSLKQFIKIASSKRYDCFFILQIRDNKLWVSDSAYVLCAYIG